MRQFAEYAICVVCLAAVATALLHPAFRGRIPASADEVFALAPWEEARPDDLTGPVAPSAEGLRHLPWAIVLRDAAARGDSVQWSPYENGGLPFAAMWQTRCYSPFSLPFRFAELPIALPISAWLKLLVAGICAFLMARRFSLPLSMALLTGVLFQLSGLLLTHLGTPLSDALPWLPLLLLYADRLSLGIYSAWPAAVIALALMLLGGDPAMVVASLLFCGVFAAIRLAMRGALRTETLNAVVSTAIVGAFALALVAFQIVPFLEFVVQASARGLAGDAPSLQLADLAALFFPRTADGWDALTAPPRHHPTALLYLGIVSIGLLPLWFSLRACPAALRRNRVEALLAAAVIMSALGLAAHPLLAAVPGLRLLQPAHFLAANALVFAFMAAEAADEWVVLDANSCQATLKRFAIALPVFAIIAVAAGVLFLGRSEQLAPLGGQLLIQGGLLLLILVLLGITLVRPSTRLLGYGLCLVACLDLGLVCQPAIRFSPPERLYPDTAFLESLRTIDARIAGTESLRQWPLAANLIPQAYSASGVRLRRHDAFLERVHEEPLLLRRMGSQALLLTRDDIRGSFARVRPKLAVKHVFTTGAILFDDLGARPRAWLAYETREADRFDPAQLDPNAPPLVENVVPAPNAPNAPAGTAEIIEERNARLVLRVETEKPATLILADAWYPGWKATVDGQRAQVFPVDGIARGVTVDAGTHEVILRYAPLSLRIGLAVTILAALGLTLITLRNALTRMKARTVR